MSEIKMYLGGDSGIKNPTDSNGNIISEGDILTNDYIDNEEYNLKITERHKTEPFYVVKVNENGGFYAESINPVGSICIDGDNKYFYLHDFRFKYCVKL